MAMRTVALCDGKFIGIETIYTVVNGYQINIPVKLKELRAKSQNNQLFCPCGCGSNLILVAGDKNLRQQHFRIKESDSNKDCRMVTEGKISVDSKIVLKCWLDDNLHAEDLESRVPISAISDSSRKYEFTLITRKNAVAINYCHDRANLSDEKLQILRDNGEGIQIIHITDSSNGGTEGQYPEGLMKIQNRQGFCLLLTVRESDYNKAELKAVFYESDLDGLWRENLFAESLLKNYRICPDGTVSLGGCSLKELLSKAKEQYSRQNDEERKRREEAEKRYKEIERQRRLEEERRQEEQRKWKEEHEARHKQLAEEAARRREEEAEKKRRLQAEFIRNVESNFEQQESQVRDAEGNRWIKCEFCGKIAMESEFSSYGGMGRINLGTCRECSANNPLAGQAKHILYSKKTKSAFDPSVCPECGSKLILRNGRNGQFIGCTGFPKCRYTRSVRMQGI